MRRHTLLCLIVVIASNTCFAQQFGSFKDPRDGKVYKIAYVGNQEWMTENLNTDRFQNGDPIPEAKTQEQWKTAYREESLYGAITILTPPMGLIMANYIIGMPLPMQEDWHQKAGTFQLIKR